MELLETFYPMTTPRDLMAAVMERHGWCLDDLADRLARETRTLNRIMRGELKLSPKLEERLQKLLTEEPESARVQEITPSRRGERQPTVPPEKKDMLSLHTEGSHASDELAKFVELITEGRSESDLAHILTGVLGASGLSPEFRTRAAQAVTETLKARLNQGKPKN